MLKHKHTIFKKEKFNNNFDVVDVTVNIEPKYLNFLDRYKFPQTFKITKLIFVLFFGRIKRIYLNGNHPNSDLQTRLFRSDHLKNKKMNDIAIDLVTNQLSKANRKNIFFELKYNNIVKKKINNFDFFFYSHKLFNTEFDIYEINKRIRPNKIIKKEFKKYKILKISENLIIERTRIFTYNDKIHSIIIDSPHPNADIVDRSFCLPPNIINQDINDINFKIIEEIIKTYNLIDPYFYPNDFF